MKVPSETLPSNLHVPNCLKPLPICPRNSTLDSFLDLSIWFVQDWDGNLTGKKDGKPLDFREFPEFPKKIGQNMFLSLIELMISHGKWFTSMRNPSNFKLIHHHEIIWDPLHIAPPTDQPLGSRLRIGHPPYIAHFRTHLQHSPARQNQSVKGCNSEILIPSPVHSKHPTATMVDVRNETTYLAP